MANIGDFSPVMGMLTGKGLMGKLAASGAVGLGPQALAKPGYEEEKRKKEEEEEAKKYGRMSRMKKGGMAKKTKTYKSGGAISSASKRADGCATKGKTKGRFV